MKRDVDLIRKILLAIEASEDDEPASISIAGRYRDVIMSHHVRILTEAGLIHAVETGHFSTKMWQPHSLTWAGHEFLAITRDDAQWERLKNAASRGGAVSLSLLRELALKEAANIDRNAA